jgi:hypothetical protein
MKSRVLQVAVVLSAFGVLHCFTPPDLPLCGFRWLTGRPCPLCGLTRATFALAKGHWREAIAFHALSPLAVMMVAGSVWGGTSWKRLWVPCAVVFGVYGVWRMFP